MKDNKVSNTDDYDFTNTFVALTAPAWAGKTQIPFTFDDSVLITFYISLATEQSIYENYFHWYQTLLGAVRSDFETFKKILSVNESANQVETEKCQPKAENTSSLPFDWKRIESLSAEILSSQYSQVHFWTLGLFWAIMKHVNEDPSRFKKLGWMTYFAELEELTFEPISIDEFKLTLAEYEFTNFVVFLDEFLNELEFIFVRNIVRAAGIRLIVAKTNANIIQPIGANIVSSHEKLTIWALVVSKLDGVNEHLLDELYNFNASLTMIQSRFSDRREGENFAYWLRREIINTRPGIADIFAQVLKSVARDAAPDDEKYRFSEKHYFSYVEYSGPFTAASILNTMLSYIANHMFIRKDGLRCFVGYRAHFGLLVPEDCKNLVPVSESDAERTGRFHHADFMFDHLYYLRNPSQPDDWKYLSVLKIENEAYKLTHFSPTGSLEVTKYSTYFWAEERLTMLICWFFPFYDSVFRVYPVDEAYGVESRSYFYQPIFSASIFGGNVLENVAACAACLASHSIWKWESYSMKYSIEAKDGVMFLRNFIRNVSAKDQCKKWNQPPPVSNSDFDFIKYLKKFKINFMYGIGRADAQFKELGMTSYKLAKHTDHIDGLFDIQYNGSVAEASIQCMNHSEAVPFKMIETAVLKAKNERLAIILVTKIAEIPKSSETISTICKKSKMNVLRFVRIDPYSYRFDSFQGIDLFPNPERICLIIELKKVNPSLQPFQTIQEDNQKTVED